MANPRDTGPITQSSEIARLSAEITDLKSTVDSVVHRLEVNLEADYLRHGGTVVQVDDRLKLLELVFTSIKSAPDQVAQNIVCQIRANHALEDVISSTTVCMERLVASPDDEVAARNPGERNRREDEEHMAGMLEHLPLPYWLEGEGKISSARTSKLPGKGKAAARKTQSRGIGWRQGALSLVRGRLMARPF
jgi:hypothetical protein